jgi:hypothetical protein
VFAARVLRWLARALCVLGARVLGGQALKDGCLRAAAGGTKAMAGMRTLARAVVAVFLASAQLPHGQRQLSNNPCDHPAPDDVTCAMGMEELCKGTFSLWAMYAAKLGTPPDTNMTCCTASVFSAECTSVWCVLGCRRSAPRVACAWRYHLSVHELYAVGFQPRNDAGAQPLSEVSRDATLSAG